ncbi:hypothetical protein HHL22_07975 [Hymenobacter sp. RP-2-7]|uniref:Antitoxin VbhA domain-containing protein n=1 Tax=Hymenobacter polaris TaxID=2682546 RepID=A0A7Y0FLT4_9BACT|nr:hypothetical protein [Hymenobacter polaris]NML65142.1 hypothetical protein [Hymenobacter polaris]
MSLSSAFGPNAQTPEQRALVLARMKQALPHIRRRLSPAAQQLHARYLAGELTWQQVCLELANLPPAQARSAR